MEGLADRNSLTKNLAVIHQSNDLLTVVIQGLASRILGMELVRRCDMFIGFDLLQSKSTTFHARVTEPRWPILPKLLDH